jgi:deoxyguanosine kinase
LADFYNDKKKYGYALQIHLLTRRLKQNRQAAEGGGVCDRTLEEDQAFVQMLRKHNFIDGRDAATYQELIRHVTIHKPDVILWLDVTPEEAFARIQRRGRACESGMTLWYMQELHKAYEVLYQQLVAAQYNIVRLDWNGSEEENASKLFEIVAMLEEKKRCNQQGAAIVAQLQPSIQAAFSGQMK